MKLPSTLSLTRIVRGAHFQWQTTVKGGRALGAGLLRVLPLRVGGRTRRWCTATFQFAKFVVALKRRSGWPFVVKYLKACCVLLQQSASGQRILNTRDLGCAVSRTAGGIPRVIPVDFRRMIRSKDIWTVRIWLSFFSLYRVIDIPGKLKINTITSPSSMNPEFLVGWYSFLNVFWGVLLEMANPRLAKLWLYLRRRSVRKDETSILPNEPSRAFVARLAAVYLPKAWKGYPWNLTPEYLLLTTSSPNTGKNPLSGPGSSGVTSSGAIFTSGLTWTMKEVSNELRPALKRWLELVADRKIGRLFQFSEKVYKLFDRLGYWDHEYDVPCWKEVTDQYVRTMPGFGGSYGLGKLGYKVEPAGKIRVFAMVDAVTQMIMAPVHKLLFKILGSIPQDGTFDQPRPANRLVELGHRKFWSYDLSSATDRFPVVLEEAVMAFVLGPELANLWTRLLVDRDYEVPVWITPNQKVPAGTPKKVRYGTGQPMGALTSWAAFSLSHHFLVQYAAYKAYGKVYWFPDYALLGDDIVIANEKVAQFYLALLHEIGVECGLAKSLISRTGGFEFAKRTYVAGKDASAISLLEVGAAKADPGILEGLLARNGKRSLVEALRAGAQVLGYGYKALARLPAVLGSMSRLQGLAILLSRPGSPYGLPVLNWLTQEGPLRTEVEVPGARVPLLDHLRDKGAERLVRALKAHISDLISHYPYQGTPWAEIGLDLFQQKRERRDNEYLEFWFSMFENDILGRMRAELLAIEDRILNLDLKNSELEIDSLYSTCEELRDDIASISPAAKIHARPRVEFGAPKRSSLLRQWRSARRVVQRCLRG